MGLQLNYQGGLSGDIGIPKYGMLFRVVPFGVDRTLTGNLINAAGRGDGIFSEERVGDVAGSFICTCWLTEDEAFSMPDNFQGEHATLQLWYHAAAKETLHVEITGHRIYRNEKTDNKLQCVINCRLRDVPDLTGFRGTQPTSASPTHTDKFLYEGLLKQLDTNGIDETASARVLVWELTDTDSAEATALATYIADAAPAIADMKQRPFTFTRTSFRASYINLSWSRVDTRDELEMNGEQETTTPDTMAETAVLREVTNSPTPPSTPAAPIGQLIEIISEPLRRPNGSYTGRWIHTFRYGPNTHTQDEQFAGSELIVDPTDLENAQVIVQINGSSTPPSVSPTDANLQLVRRRSKQIQGTPVKWRHVFEYGRNTTANLKEIAATRTETDPDGFGGRASIGVVHTSATPPSAPSTPLGEATGNIIEPLDVPSGTFTGLWLHTFLYGVSTRKQTIEMKGPQIVDQTTQESSDTQTLTATSITPPADPGTRIVGMVLRKITSNKVQNTPAKWEHQYEYGWRSTDDDLVAAETRSLVDASALQSEYFAAAVFDPGSPPADPSPASGYELIDHLDLETKDPAARIRKWRFGLRNNQHAWEEDHSFTFTDPDGLVSEAEVALIGSTPSVPSGMVSRGERDVNLTPTKVGKVVKAGLRSNKEDIERPGSFAEFDFHWVTTVHTCSSGDTNESLKDTLITALEAGGTPWAKARIEKTNSTHYIQRVLTPTDDKKVSRHPGGVRMMRSLLDPSGTYVKLVDVRTVGSGQISFALREYSFPVVYERVVLRRYFNVSSESDVNQMALVGTWNSMPFLGYPAQTLNWAGSEDEFFWTDEGGAHWIAIDYHFDAIYARDALGTLVGANFSDSNIPGAGYYLLPVSYAEGDTPAATVLDTSWVVSTPVNADYSGLLT